jgi:hypothetical protein
MPDLLYQSKQHANWGMAAANDYNMTQHSQHHTEDIQKLSLAHKKP